MAQKIEGAAPTATGNGPEISLPEKYLDPTTSTAQESLQRFRASVLARRHRLAPSMANALAAIVFPARRDDGQSLEGI